MSHVDEIGYRLPRNTISLEQMEENRIDIESGEEEMPDAEYFTLIGASSRKNISSIFQLNQNKERKYK